MKSKNGVVVGAAAYDAAVAGNIAAADVDAVDVVVAAAAAVADAERADGRMQPDSGTVDTTALDDDLLC